MRIGVDARCLNRTHLRGMGKAVFETLSVVSRDAGFEFALFADEPRVPLAHPNRPNVSVKVWETRGHRLRTWEQFSLPSAAAAAHCDVLHCPATWCPVWQPVPTVVTVHDTLPWQEEPASFFHRLVLPLAYRRARIVITDSNSSRDDILARWPDLSGKVMVIPLGVHERFFSARRHDLPNRLREQGATPPYLLYFGGRIARKRLDWALKVWLALKSTSVSLVVCGLEEAARSEWEQRVPHTHRSRFHCLGFVTEEDLPSLCANAEAVLYPTLYEGFGLPALEAQATGTPVLMSPLGSLRELAGPGAVLLRHDNLDEWVSACEEVLAGHSPPSSSESREWCRQRFSWQTASDATIQAYLRASAR